MDCVRDGCWGECDTHGLKEPKLPWDRLEKAYKDVADGVIPPPWIIVSTECETKLAELAKLFGAKTGG